jgi:hypothetical protein
LASEEAINLPDWISELAESMADLILYGASESERAAMIAHGQAELRRLVEKRRK